MCLGRRACTYQWAGDHHEYGRKRLSLPHSDRCSYELPSGLGMLLRD